MLVRDTVITSCRQLTGVDGEAWKQWEIAWEGMAFRPGQFVMVADTGGLLDWPTPLMLQETTGKRLRMLVHPHSPLYRLGAHAAVTVWGPAGTPPSLPEAGPLTLVADGAGSLLALPFLRRYRERCESFVLVGRDSVHPQPLLGDVPVVTVSSFEEWNPPTGPVVAALPLEDISRMRQNGWLDGQIPVWAFAGVKIGCGVGACRGCHIHGKQGGEIAVCRSGPFLPVEKIDYAQDQNFLHHFI